MKKFEFILLMLLFAGFCFADTTNVIETKFTETTEIPEIVKEEIANSFWQAVIEVIHFVNWIYLIIFILSTWLLNDLFDSKNKKTAKVKFLNFISKKQRKSIRALIVGIFLVLVFYWAIEYTTKN